MTEDKYPLEIKAKCYVRATKDFNNSKKTSGKYVCKAGTIGFVKRVDSAGDFLVDFPEFPSCMWAYKSHNQIEAIETPEAGSRVYATKDFNHTTSGDTSLTVKEGMQGNVISIDKDGDFLVKFDDLPKNSWSFRRQCEILTVINVSIGSRVIAKYPPYQGKTDDPWFIGEICDVAPYKQSCSIRWTDNSVSHNVKSNMVRLAPQAPYAVGKPMGNLRFNSLQELLQKCNFTATPVTFCSPVPHNSTSQDKPRSNASHVGKVGSRVIGKYPPYRNKPDNPWFTGVICGVSRDKQSCSIRWCDGDVSKGVKASEIRYAPSAPEDVGKKKRNLRCNDLQTLLRRCSFSVQLVSFTTSNSFDSSLAAAGQAIFVEGLAEELGGNIQHVQEWMRTEQQGKPKHRIMFLIAPGASGFGEGDIVSFKSKKTSTHYKAKVIGISANHKRYTIQIKVNGQLTTTVVKDVKASDLTLVKAVEHGSDNVDLKGVWSGDVASILKTLGGKFDFAISRECGSAPRKTECCKKLKRYFSERDWPWDYYWVFYSGHGSSNGGAWCLPNGDKMYFRDIQNAWNGSEAQQDGARLVIVSDSCYCGKLADAARKSGARDIVSVSTSLELGWSGGNFTSNWCELIKSHNFRSKLPSFSSEIGRQGSCFHIGWSHKVESAGNGITFSKVEGGPVFIATPKTS